MSIERIKSLFISGVNCNWCSVIRRKENGRPTASQAKLNAGSESGIVWGGWGFLREFFRTFAHLLERYKGDAIEGTEL